MPKKKTNVEVNPQITYDVELCHGSIKGRTIIPYANFLASVDSIVESVFANGYSPANLSYLYYSNLFLLFTDYKAADVEIDDVMSKVYVDHLDREIYNISPMAVAFRDAVRDAVDYRKSRSAADMFFEKINAIDISKVTDALTNLSSAQLSKDDITKVIVEAAKR